MTEEITEHGAELDSSFAKLGTEIGKLSRRSGRQRTILAITVASLVLDIILSIIIYGIAKTGRETAIEAASAKHAAVLICQAGVQSRHDQADAWDKLIALSNQTGPVKPLTPEEQVRQNQLLKGFEEYLDGLRIPRNCNNPSSLVTSTTTTIAKVNPTR